MVLDEILSILEYHEDYDWDIGEFAGEVIHIVKSIISEDRFQTEMDGEAIFEVVLERTKLTSNESIGWDEIEGDLFSVLKLFAKDEKYREWLKQVFLSRTTEDNRYRNSLILGFIYELIEKYESEQEKLSFLKHNKILDTLLL